MKSPLPEIIGNNSISPLSITPYNLVILGLGGTGKSYNIQDYIVSLISNKVLKREDFILLSFDRSLRMKHIRNSSCFDSSNTHTVHSLCFSVLERLGKLPEAFKQNVSYDTINTEELSSRDFALLINTFLGLDNEDIAEIPLNCTGSNCYKDIKLICCDEVQDFREDYIEVVRKMKQIAPEIKVILAGDRHQRIYSFQNKHSNYKLSDVIVNPERFFGDESYKLVILTKNYRTKNTSILQFINSFIRNTYNTPDEELYDIDENIKTKWCRKPILRYFTNRNDELQYVVSEIESISNDNNIVILGRSNKLIDPYVKQFTGQNNITVETIHKTKGDEADYVFYIGFTYNPNEDEEITTLCYTAISRPRIRLYITSSYPAGIEVGVFNDGEYELVNTQKKFSKLYSLRMKIRENRNFSWGKLENNHLDSLVLKVSENSCPFTPYIIKNNTKQNTYSSSMRVVIDNGIEYSIEKHHPSGTYFFRFMDLNLLKKNSLNDIQILQYCANKVMKYFDQRVRITDIAVHELHLCSFLKFDNNEDIQNFFHSELKDKIINSKNRMILTNYGKPLKYNVNFIDFNALKYTLYVNHHKNKHNSLTTAMYYPKNKNNSNKIHISNIYKIEIRGKGIFLKEKIGLGKDTSIGNLLDYTDKYGLLPIYYKWMNYYYGENMVEVIRKKLGVLGNMTK